MTKLWVTRIRLIAPPRLDTHAPRLMSPPSWVPGALLEGAHPLKPTILTNLFYVIKAPHGKKKLTGYRRVCHSLAGIPRAVRAASATRRGGHLDDVDDGLEAVAEGDGEELGGVIANLGTEPNVRPTHERLDIIGPKIGDIIFLENIPEADIRCGGDVVFQGRL
jgi:hypothetical protein